jgi:hypothetical protein
MAAQPPSAMAPTTTMLRQNQPGKYRNLEHLSSHQIAQRDALFDGPAIIA